MDREVQSHEPDVGVFFEHIKHYVDWTEWDARSVKSMWGVIEPEVTGIVDDFYDAIMRHAFTAKVMSGGAAQVSRLKGTLTVWLQSLFSGVYDTDFALSRWRVGKRHVEIGLNQAYAMAALARIRKTIIERLCHHSSLSREEIAKGVLAINKLLDMDAAIIDFAYQQSFAAKLEQSALAKVKQKERLAFIGQMVTGLAHESRNALQRSQACLEALKLDVEDRPEALKQATRIESALDRLNVLYEEVRNYAAPINLDRQLVDIARVCHTAWQNLYHRWNAMQTQFELIEPSEGSCLVSVDRHRIDQVFTNLFQNSLDASGPQGRVRCTVTRNASAMECVVQIDDSGPGVPDEVIARVFEPFFTTKSKGTGLGLAITKRIVDAHGGTLLLSRNEWGGARFEFRLPCTESTAHEGQGDPF
jgi:signal transduction histidine kinase